MQWLVFLFSVFYCLGSLNIKGNRVFYANPHLKKAKFSANPHSLKCIFNPNPHLQNQPHLCIYMIFLFQSAFFSYRNPQSVISHNYQYHFYKKWKKELPFRESRSSYSILFLKTEFHVWYPDNDGRKSKRLASDNALTSIYYNYFLSLFNNVYLDSRLYHAYNRAKRR